MKRDERIVRLAENVVNYSVGVQKGERIYVECFGASAQPLFEEVIAAVTRAGGVPFYYCNDNAFIRDFLRCADEAQIKAYAEMHRGLMEDCAGYVGIRGFDDIFALSELPAEKNALWAKYFWEAVHTRVRLNKRWCVMRYPNVTMAAMSKMSLKEFEDFYFEACLLDYRKMGAAMSGLQKLMERPTGSKSLRRIRIWNFRLREFRPSKARESAIFPTARFIRRRLRIRLTVMCSLTPTAPITVRYFRASGWNLRTDGL